MTSDPHLAAATRAIRAGLPVPAIAAAHLEARGYDINALYERLQNN